MTEDPFRADAAVVFRSLRDSGPARAVDLIDRCFPVPAEGPETTQKAIRKRSMRRVLDSIIWMRHQGVTISVVPDAEGSVFHLGEISMDVASKSYTLFKDGKVVRVGSWAAPEREEVVTANLSQGSVGASRSAENAEVEGSGDVMDVWHGR